MDHKEYSSGGPEYFPTGQEFSPARQEFPRLSPELASAAPEMDQSGGEFHQTAGPDQAAEKKRRRNISPAMLTTAAVVTAAVAVLPLSSSFGSGGRYPNMELSAQSRAYLDEVWEALPLGDPEQLIELAADERLRTLTVHEVTPYLEMLEEKYGFGDHHEDCELCNDPDGYTLLEGSHHSYMQYDGQTAGLSSSGMGSSVMWFSHERYILKEYPDTIHSDAHFERMDFAPDSETADGYWASINFDESLNGYDNTYIRYERGQYAWTEVDGDEYLLLDSGYVYDRSQVISGDPDTPDTWYDTTLAEGDFSSEAVPSQSSDYSKEIRTYLHNGTITITRAGTFYQGSPFTFQIQVVDGVIQLTDQMVVEYAAATGYYRLFVEYYDELGYQHEESLYSSSEASSEEEFLRSIKWYTYGLVYMID